MCIDGEWVSGHHEAIIERDLFYRVQALWDERNFPAPIRYKTTHLLLHQSGKFHGDDGASISFNKERGGIYRAFKTTNMKTEMGLTISAKVVEDAFFNLLLDNIASTEDFKDFTDAADGVREKRDKQRAGITENITEVDNLIVLENAKMDAAKGHANLQAIVVASINEIARLTTRKVELEQKLNNIPDDGTRMVELAELLHALRDHANAFDVTALQDLTVLAAKDVLLMLLTRNFILLRVEWEHLWPTQDVVIYRKLSGRDEPEPEEMEFLKANYMTMDFNELLEGVPGMTLDSIVSAMKQEGYDCPNVPGIRYKSSYGRWKRRDPGNLKYDARFSVDDYRVMEQYGIPLEAVQEVKERGIYKKQEYEVMAVSCATNADLSTTLDLRQRLLEKCCHHRQTAP
jgi:hypothetical protein